MDDRPLLIVNPRAGGGSAGRRLASIAQTTERVLGPVDIVTTEHGGHAVDLASDAVHQGRARIIALGGDGTVSEVANGILSVDPNERTNVHLGIIGQGTGGDLARTLGLEHRLDRYLETIARKQTRSIDAGRVEYTLPDGARKQRWFVNILSVGMGGLVDRYVADAPRALSAKSTYFAASLKALLNIRRGHLKVRFSLAGREEERRFPSYMIAICNGRYFGAGMHVAPMASPDDGRFEVVSIDAPNKAAFYMATRTIWDAGHLDRPGVTHFACDRLRLEIENDRDAGDLFVNDIDGEALGGLPLDVELVPRAISIYA